jgi:hypothetical protein
VLTIKPKYGVQVCLKPLEPWYGTYIANSWEVGLGYGWTSNQLISDDFIAYSLSKSLKGDQNWTLIISTVWSSSTIDIID